MRMSVHDDVLPKEKAPCWPLMDCKNGRVAVVLGISIAKCRFHLNIRGCHGNVDVHRRLLPVQSSTHGLALWKARRSAGDCAKSERTKCWTL